MSTYGVSLLASLLLIASSVLPVVYRFFTDDRRLDGHRIRVELANPAPEGRDAARDGAPGGRR